MDEKMDLKYPIEIKPGVTVTFVTFRRMKAKDLKYLPADGNITPTTMLPLIGALTGLDQATLDEMDVDDLKELGDKIENFMSEPRPTGGK